MLFPKSSILAPKPLLGHPVRPFCAFRATNSSESEPKPQNAISLSVISPTRISVTRREDSTSATDGNSDQAG
jgi:hypothetical protein